MRRLFFVSLVLAAVTLPGMASPARADGVKVAVVPFAPLTGDVPVRAGGKGAMLLAGELKNVGTVTPLEVALEPNDAAGKALNAAHEAVTAAQLQEKKRKFGAAAALYRKAIAAYDAGAALLADPSELSDAHVCSPTPTSRWPRCST